MTPADTWESAVARGPAGGAMPAYLRAVLDVRDNRTRVLNGTRVRISRPVRASRRLTLPARRPGDEEPRVLLSRDGSQGYERKLSQLGVEELINSHPMRTFSRRNAQSNKPVAQFSRTTNDLVGCESQHERRFVLLADFLTSAVHIAAQPFTIDFPTGSELTSHTPDFAVIGALGAIVVIDVKWPTRALDAVAVRRHEIVRNALNSAGIAHFVWTGVASVVTENLANFAAARVPDGMMLDLAPKLLSTHQPSTRVHVLLERASHLHGIDPNVGLVVVRRMLWDQQFTVDLNVRFSPDSELDRP
ncbi:hypothetical protein SAMN06295909_0128 [Plantibacter sp. VKM Ac-1784]|uniref:TnsA endonuclease N-terminal domain-containing protein n=1 Tax=Plantibacter elymi (nom. nud.) TaxID=199708 RepID=A0ABY1R7H1_9MICO|nr:hypothetical protein [Plantibacter sp. VKM Ac-1784]SMQ58242.1 hypothetical protein SAMN06295909_0128 [Plantibacter sp. VKM Ac-1784]